MEFEVRTLGAGGEISPLAINAASAEEACALAESQGLAVLSVRRGRNGKLLSRKAGFPLILFTQELLALLKAGLNLLGAVATLTEKESRAEVRRVLEAILSSLNSGMTFSAALAEHPAVFPPLYVAAVRASEKSGGLGDALGRYVAFHSQLDVLRKKIVSASIYPALLIIVGGLVVLFLMGYVVPRFSAIYESAGKDIPLLSRLLLQWGLLVEQHRGWLMAGFAGGAAGVVHTLSRENFRNRLLAQAKSLPGVGEHLRVFQLARFYRTLGMLLRSGIPLLNALEMSADLLQGDYRERLKRAAADIQEGKSISHAMDGNGLTTPVAARLLRVGEQTGQMGEMMEHIAEFHDEEMGRWVEWFTRLFEPLIMAFIGLFIGIIVVMMYLPIFELAGSLQ
jgi:general secretion pathway protein F